jgi:hypothetical protein
MVLNEPLSIDAVVSPRLLESADQIQAIYHCWNRSMSFVSVDAKIGRRLTSPGLLAGKSQCSALFFSLGVDSTYSLLKHLPASTQPVDHLIIVEGFDVYLWERERFSPMLSNVRSLADRLGLGVLAVTTNLREVSDRVIDWVAYYHGPAMASVALALGHKFSTVHISAAQTYSCLIPRGVHPLLDPLWGTEKLSFHHEGLEATRLDKIRALARYPFLVECLRVCITDEVTDSYNCGRCEKCVRTMLGLYVAGALEHCKTLPHKLDLEVIRRLNCSNPVARAALGEICEALSDHSGDFNCLLVSAIEGCLDNKANQLAAAGGREHYFSSDAKPSNADL